MTALRELAELRECRECLAKAVNAVNGPLLTDKNNEQAGWAAVSFLQSHGAQLLAILDAEGEGGAVGEADKEIAKSIIEPMPLEQIISTLLAAPGTSAWGSTVTLYTTEAASMIVTLRQILAERAQSHPARSGAVSDEDVDAVIKSVERVNTDGMDGYSWDRILVRAALEHFAKSREREDARDEVLLAALKETRRELHACQAAIHLHGWFDPAYVIGAMAAISHADAAMSAKEGKCHGK